MHRVESLNSGWSACRSVGHDERRAKCNQRLNLTHVRIINTRGGEAVIFGAGSGDDPQMGAGLAKLHELSADAQFAAARNLEAHNPTSTRGLSRIFLKAVLPGRRYLARSG